MIDRVNKICNECEIDKLISEFNSYCNKKIIKS